jgi:hypothetical protein
VLRFDLPEPARVDLRVYDVAGREVARAVSGEWAAGTHAVRWQARDAGGRALEAGVYFSRLRAETRSGRTLVESRPLTVVQ